MERKRSSGFRRIFTAAFDRLFQVRLGYVNVNDCPAWLGNWPSRVRAPTQGLDIGEKLQRKYDETRYFVFFHAPTYLI